MVTRSRRFPTPPGYSRLDAKRDAERAVAESLDARAVRRLSRAHDVDPQQNSHLVLELGPSDEPPGALDLRAALAAAPAAKPPATAAHAPARTGTAASWSARGRAALRVAGRWLLHTWDRFVAWASWR